MSDTVFGFEDTFVNKKKAYILPFWNLHLQLNKYNVQMLVVNVNKNKTKKE